MRKTILTLVGAAVLATATVQIADAAQKQRKVQRTPTPVVSEQFRNSNAAWPQQSVQPDWRYSGGFSAPAGH
jgi:hypothetical protein